MICILEKTKETTACDERDWGFPRCDDVAVMS